MIRKEKTGEKSIQYRCPTCHYLVEKDILFNICCPICGWVSPLVKSRQIIDSNSISQVDLIDEGDILRLTADLPMLDENNIMLDVNGNKLLISSQGYARIIQLNYPVGKIIEKTYSNGVLDVQLKKMER